MSVKRGTNAHFLTRPGQMMTKATWIIVITVLIIIVTSFITHGTNVPVEEVPVEQDISMLETIPLKDIPKKPEKVTEKVPERVERAPVAVVPDGSCHDWMNQAGITDTANAYVLIMRESGCRPDAVNPSSGACGIGQQLPCGKWPHTWNDPIGGMIDMQGYVFARYGSWANAVAFSSSNGWY